MVAMLIASRSHTVNRMSFEPTRSQNLSARDWAWWLGVFGSLASIIALLLWFLPNSEKVGAKDTKIGQAVLVPSRDNGQSSVSIPESIKSGEDAGATIPIQPSTPLTISAETKFIQDSTERLVATTADDSAILYARELPYAVEFRVKLRTGWREAIDVDVNQNGAVDPMLDVTYGRATDSVSPCNQYRMTDHASTFCGEFKSNSAFLVQEEADFTDVLRTIPKAELTTVGPGVWLRLRAFNMNSGQWAAPVEGRITFIWSSP